MGVSIVTETGVSRSFADPLFYGRLVNTKSWSHRRKDIKDSHAISVLPFQYNYSLLAAMFARIVGEPTLSLLSCKIEGQKLKYVIYSVHYDHGSANFLVNVIAALIAYTHKEKKPSINIRATDLGGLPAIVF